MRTLLMLLFTVFATQAVALEIMMRCETKVGSPVNIYKYIQEGENKQVLRRLDAEWVAWCQNKPTSAEQKAVGWGELDTSLKITDKGAVCSQIGPYTPKQTQIENMLIEGVNYIWQRETILDFEFFTRTQKIKMENPSKGIQPSKFAPQYFTCKKI